MIPLPGWMKEIFASSICPYCKERLMKKGVYGVGIREEKSRKRNRSIKSLYYEYKCPHCNNRAIFTGFPTTFDDFVGDIMEIASLEMEDGEDSRASMKEITGITDKEIESGKKMINETKYYEDFLSKLGIMKIEPPEPETNEDK